MSQKRTLYLLCTLGLLFAVAASPARAERIVFQRGDALFVAGADGKETRRLFAIGDPFEVVWAPSPDGRRLAWYTAAKPGSAADPAAPGLGARPIAVWISDLSGQRRKLLLTTDTLRDRRGRRVTELAVEGAKSLDEWSPASLAWDPGGKSLYLSCTYLGAARERATFVADAATGTAVVDARGRWKSIAPVTEVDVRWPLLVGVGLERTPGRPGPPDALFPLFVTNLAEGETRSLLPATLPGADRPPYALAASPALSRDGKSIAFAAIGDGLWQTDVRGRDYRRLTDNRADDAPRWSEDGKRLLFLSVAPPGPGVTTDLYGMPLPAAPSAGKRRLVLKDVSRFFVVPD